MAAGDGDLFAGPRPAQANLDDQRPVVRAFGSSRDMFTRTEVTKARHVTPREIKALTPKAISQLPTEELRRLLDAVQTVDLDSDPNRNELDLIKGTVRTTRHRLADELNTRSNRLCGGLEDPYLVIRSPEISGK